jgi:glycosyltransferase involved in cell wall biosynthesis
MRNKRWKVLEVVEATSAGVGRHVSDLASTIDLNRFDVSLAWSPRRADERFRDTVEQLRAKGVQTYAIPMSRGLEPITDLRALARLRSLISREQFDLVHVHSSKAGFLGRVAARLARHSALTVYSPNAIAIPLNRIYWYPEKVAGWLTDALIAVSETERQELSGYKLVPPEKLVRVTSGIPIPECHAQFKEEIRRGLNLPAEATVIGTVGRVSFQKDPQTFLAAAETVVRINPSVYFLWIGDGEDLEAMRSEAEQRGIAGRVRFIGYRKDAQHLLQGVDIFVLTSRYESFGYVTCEAMAFGKPVVASRVTGSSELVKDGVTGFLVPASDPAAFAAALQRLVDDRDLREAYGSAGRLRVEQYFSLRRMVSETEQLYLNLLTARRVRGRRAVALGRSAEAK